MFDKSDQIQWRVRWQVDDVTGDAGAFSILDWVAAIQFVSVGICGWEW